MISKLLPLPFLPFKGCIILWDVLGGMYLGKSCSGWNFTPRVGFFFAVVR